MKTTNNIFKLILELRNTIPKDRLNSDPMLCYAYGTDASLYRLTPQLVIIAINNAEIIAIIKSANKYKMGLTFRAAGTSLSGQAVTNQILVVLANYSWQKYTVATTGQYITLEPGIIGATANAILKPYNMKIGPDPASIHACKIGGIAANNASGMCCGTDYNSYKTLQAIKIILAGGTVLDTGDANSRSSFSMTCPEIVNGLKSIREQIISNPTLVELITRKFKIKNTSAYSLNAFLDFADPIDILAHLMIGSEGTLGFISEITYTCIPNNSHKAVSVVYFNTLPELITLALALSGVSFKPDALELLDITALHAIKDLKKAKPYLPELGIDTAALLIEVSAASAMELNKRIQQVQQILTRYSLIYQINFSRNTDVHPQQYDEIWALRKGVYPAIGAARVSGESVIIEDVAVAVEQLPDVISRLRPLFQQHEYQNAAIFGHILAGNIHFVFTPRFDNPDAVLRYKMFMQDMAKLVAVEFQGSLKAEHGCGRNITPFIELEWGSAAYKIMWQIKQLLDPNNILNPDVILSHNPNLNVENLKILHSTDPQIDKCTECGYCEPVCPSRNLSLTPRQRISVYREMPRRNKRFKNAYQYYGIDTCATTNLCASSCPVHIDTGNFILKLKQHKSGRISQCLSLNFKEFVTISKDVLNLTNWVARVIGRENTQMLSRKVHKVIPLVPVYLSNMPQAQMAKFISDTSVCDDDKVAAAKQPPLMTTQAQVMYIPSCNNRIFADASCDSKDGSSNAGQANAMQQLLKLMGYEIVYPRGLANLCCGQVFGSAGDFDTASVKHTELQLATQNVQIPVVMDNSSCVYTASGFSAVKQNNIQDVATFIYHNLDKLNLTAKYNKLALHVDCGCQKLGNKEYIMAVLKRCGREIVVPRNIDCCGFAGSMGFTQPELNQTALYGLRDQVSSCDIGITLNRNCQIGLSQYSGLQYLSLAEIVLNCAKS